MVGGAGDGDVVAALGPRGRVSEPEGPSVARLVSYVVVFFAGLVTALVLYAGSAAVWGYQPDLGEQPAMGDGPREAPLVPAKAKGGKKAH